MVVCSSNELARKPQKNSSSSEILALTNRMPCLLVSSPLTPGLNETESPKAKSYLWQEAEANVLLDDRFLS